MNARAYSMASLKKYGSLIVATAVVLVCIFLGTTGATAATPITVTPTNQISNQYYGQSANDFVQSFWVTGTTPADIYFRGVWWPNSDPNDKHVTIGIGERAAGTLEAQKTEVTLEIAYASTNPGTLYSYSIEDSTGVSYYVGSFTTPGTATTGGSSAGSTTSGSAGGSGSASNGITVTPSLSSDGLTVTFSMTGVPTTGADIDFTLSYGSSSNYNYLGGTVDLGTFHVNGASPQTLSFTLPSNGSGVVTDSQGFVMSPADIWYELRDQDQGATYAAGVFGASSSGSGTASSGSSSGTTVVTPTSSGSSQQLVINTTPDQSGGLVPCDGRDSKSRCGFAQVVELINKVMTWLIYMTVPIAAVMFSYAGFLFLTKGTSEEARSKAKGIFINVAIGLIFIVASVLIIKTILAALGVSGAYSSFL